MTAGALLAAAAPIVGAGWYGLPMVGRLAAQRRLARRCAETRTLVLTFDDGPGEELTPQVLDLLDDRKATATFFLMGDRALEHPDIVHRAAAAGHELACHSRRHLNAWRTWPWRSVADIADGYEALAPWIAGDAMYRPPSGKLTAVTWAALRRRGAPLGWWTIVADDLEPHLPEPDCAAERARRAGGGVVLLHDFDRGEDRARFVLASTERLLDAAEESGWQVRTLGSVLRDAA
jgi:peptidoglycan/xylan/chitin deacetylase (PgdA/CDA1 family)